MISFCKDFDLPKIYRFIIYQIIPDFDKHIVFSAGKDVPVTVTTKRCFGSTTIMVLTIVLSLYIHVLLAEELLALRGGKW